MTVIINGTTGITNDGGYTGDGIVFADTTPANTLVTTTSGNVGIGTSSPSQKFHVAGASSTYTRVSSTNAFTGAGAYYQNATATWLIGAGPASGGSEFAFVDQSSGSIERMRIDSSGNLLVGTTNVPSTGAGTNSTIVSNKDYSSAFAQIINSSSTTGIQFFIQFGRGSSECGKITSTGTNSTTYATSSDYRLKEAIAPMMGALARVAALKPVTYKWKLDGSDGEGFIAHELQAVVPDCVTGEKDAVDADGNPQYQGIDTSFLAATLTAALQEQQAIIESLTARITALEGKP